MPAATSDDVRDIFLDHLDRLRADYARRAKDCTATAEAATDTDGWTHGLNRGMALAYDLAAHDLGEAIDVERGLTRAVTSIPGGH
tara:strand:- start:296 stop:550 length:255 start_codon:yes stop_codon:yes gene_type:complete